MAVRVLVVADDVTGAADASVQFVARGLAAGVMLSPDRWMAQEAEELPGTFPGAPDVLALNTQSRSAPPGRVEGLMSAAVRVIRALRPQVVFKKIDSTLRGNFGLEVALLARALAPDAVLVAPSYPDLARVIVGGYLLVRGQLVTATEAAADPTAPVAEAHLPSLLESQTGLTVGHLELQYVLRGPDAILGRLAELRGRGAQVIACDAASADHLLDIARAAADLYRRILWVGAAGLAAALAELGGGTVPAGPGAGVGCPPRPQDVPLWQAPPAVLVVVGSLTRTARSQLDALAAAGVPVTVLDTEALQRDFDREAGSAVARTVRALHEPAPARGRSAGPRVAVLATSGPARSPQGSPPGTVEGVPHLVGRVTAMVDAPPGTALVLTGGDTAFGVLAEAGCVALQVCTELMPGVALSTAVGGSFARWPVVTKAGSFGDEMALLRIVDMLSRRC